MKGNRGGPKPKPTAIKQLEGNPGKRPLNKNEPKPQGKAICPSWLLPDAKKEWRRMSSQLSKLGLLTSVDQTAFAVYCQAYARWKEAEEILKEKGLTFERKDPDKGEYSQQRPEVAIAHKMMEKIRSFCAEFGLTPSSRSRMSLPGDKDDDREFEDLLD